MKEQEDPSSKNVSYGLIGAYGLVYLGIAVCRSFLIACHML